MNILSAFYAYLSFFFFTICALRKLGDTFNEKNENITGSSLTPALGLLEVLFFFFLTVSFCAENQTTEAAST